MPFYAQARKDTSENNLDERTGVGASARLLTKASTGGSTLQWRNPEFAVAYNLSMLIATSIRSPTYYIIHVHMEAGLSAVLA